MKQEEKSQKTRQRIIDRALKEFSEKGYGGSSVNTVCNSEGISKGLLYHYFDSKDDLYLACVNQCFTVLTAYLNDHMRLTPDAEARLKLYFDVRLAFFRENPIYQPIFCEAVIMAPEHLKSDIRLQRADFDAYNTSLLDGVLASLNLRPGITKEDVRETLSRYQDFINAQYRVAGSEKIDIENHEKSCRKALDILLYGAVERG